MLYWTMLAAYTVGPGTVVTCSRCAAELFVSEIFCIFSFLELEQSLS